LGERRGMKKCRPETQKFCDNLNVVVDENGQYGSGRRLFVTKTMNMKEGVEGVALAYQWGRKPREFTFLIHCPFCGVDLWEKRKTRKIT
jgi:hypothetical protein